MFFAGIVMNHTGRDHGVVVVEKVIQRAKKEYFIHEAVMIPPEESGGDPVAFIRSLYQNSRFIKKKKVFSQSKRPAKNTASPPLVLIFEPREETPVVRELRESLIPVEAFFFCENKGWNREELKILRHGGNYHVHPEEMANMARLLDSPSITIMDECRFASDLKTEMERFVETAGSRGGPPDAFQDASYVFLPPLFLSLWHCETIRQIKRY